MSIEDNVWLEEMREKGIYTIPDFPDNFNTYKEYREAIKKEDEMITQGLFIANPIDRNYLDSGWREIARERGLELPEDNMTKKELRNYIAEEEEKQKEQDRQELIEDIKDFTFKTVDTLVLPALTIIIVAAVIIKMIKKELLINGKIQLTKHKKKDNKKVSTDKTVSNFIKEMGQDTVTYIKANTNIQDKIKNYDTYGFVKENPIYTCMPDGSEEYLSRLMTDKGERLTYKRLGSTSADNIIGMIDIYELYLDNQPHKTIYVNMYSPENSKDAPTGFLLKSKN